MYARALAIWFVIMVIAIINGGVRDALMVPRLGDDAARALSCLTLAAAILFVTWLSLQWMGVLTTADAWTAGAVWLAMTLSFEFIAGHYVFGTSWPTLLADYNILAGRLWIVVLGVTLTAPVLLHRAGHYLVRDAEFSSSTAANRPRP